MFCAVYMAIVGEGGLSATSLASSLIVFSAVDANLIYHSFVDGPHNMQSVCQHSCFSAIPIWVNSLERKVSYLKNVYPDHRVSE